MKKIILLISILFTINLFSQNNDRELLLESLKYISKKTDIYYLGASHIVMYFDKDYFLIVNSKVNKRINKAKVVYKLFKSNRKKFYIFTIDFGIYSLTGSFKYNGRKFKKLTYYYSGKDTL
jgi:hypothetical protein